ncbi:MAG: hypothetical protein JRJ14_03890 [Deltaproteobacteria bacterium]|nr:hypothetical protein [Deltaproteobacteria bacterium]
MKKKGSLDFYLILATVAVLFVISAICIYSMFYFKLAQVQQMEPAIKAAYMSKMNTVISPFLIILILLLGICVPKRLLPTQWLVRFTALLGVVALAVSFFQGIKMGLVVVLAAALVLQIIVLVLVVIGSERLNFTKKGYWVRVGSSLLHMGMILFVLDLFFYRQQALHLILFWVTTGATVLGMTFCFYADSVVGLFRRKEQRLD